MTPLGKLHVRQILNNQIQAIDKDFEFEKFSLSPLTANIKGLEKNHTYLWFFLIIEFIITNYNRRNTKIDKEKKRLEEKPR
ncbi:hypothetical protein H8356DRAFT_1360642 [Neocallimastix lanati (nom. inval.)]|nr:hypothetical protein H8356DRAFT_1360642 [Neocallimastix sp. JGI-2020a]